MKRSGFAALTGLAALVVCLCGSALLQASAKPMSYKLPAETAELKAGPNLDVVRNNCTSCHSADYIAIQPRDQKDEEGFWKTEVNKMIHLYGAPIDQADVGKIVEYLSRTYAH